MKVSIAEHVAVTPGTCGGKPHIRGHRVRVQDIAILSESFGLTPDEILAYYPRITLADVHAALAYYFDHRDAIRRHIKESDALAKAVRTHIPSKLIRKLGGRDAAETPVSPR